MTYPPDIRYACAMLGLAPGASAREAREILANALAYRFATRERIKRIERLAQFLAERAKLGSPQDSFTAIRKSYHQRAMELHPDRNAGNRAAEDRLKALNAAYELIEDIHAEAVEHFAKNAGIRHAIENEARAETEREAEAAAKNPRTVRQSYAETEEHAEATPGPKPKSEPAPRGAVKYLAAWVPRYIRNRRLFYLGSRAIIGSRLLKSQNGGLLYDLIMLPEREFMRARLELGIEGSGNPVLEMTNLVPAYIPVDVRQVAVPPGEDDPETFAKTWFQREYGLLKESQEKES